MEPIVLPRTSIPPTHTLCGSDYAKPPNAPECPSDSDGAAAGAAVLMALGARQKELLCALGHPVCVGGSLVSKRILEGSDVCFRLPILHRGKFSRASNEMGRRTHREHLKARPSSPCWIHTSRFTRFRLPRPFFTAAALMFPMKNAHGSIVGRREGVGAPVHGWVLGVGMERVSFW
jgi:hypothetical protein